MGLDIMIDEISRKKNGKLKKKDAYYWRRFGDLQEALFNSWIKMNDGLSDSPIEYFNGIWIDIVPHILDDLEEELKGKINPEIRKYKKWMKEDPDEDYTWEINHWKELDRFFKNIRSDMKKGKRYAFCCSW